MPASSISTYLDVTRAASGPTKSSAGEADEQATTQAAKVLAALFAGKESLPELKETTELDSTEVLAALTSLAQAGLCELEEKDGAVSARLSESAKAALKSA
jgi:DNA-binding IclR family transcriptional regulator